MLAVLHKFLCDIISASLDLIESVLTSLINLLEGLGCDAPTPPTANPSLRRPLIGGNSQIEGDGVQEDEAQAGDAQEDEAQEYDAQEEDCVLIEAPALPNILPPTYTVSTGMLFYGLS